jgi:hypothetical protein
MKVIWRAISVGFNFLFALGCAPKGLIQEDATGKCQPPPHLVTSKVDFTIKGDAVNKFITGEVDLKSEPQVYLLASQSMTDGRVADYLDCLAQYRDWWTKNK